MLGSFDSALVGRYIFNRVDTFTQHKLSLCVFSSDWLLLPWWSGSLLLPPWPWGLQVRVTAYSSGPIRCQLSASICSFVRACWAGAPGAVREAADNSTGPLYGATVSRQTTPRRYTGCWCPPPLLPRGIMSSFFFLLLDVPQIAANNAAVQQCEAGGLQCIAWFPFSLCGSLWVDPISGEHIVNYACRSGRAELLRYAPLLPHAAAVVSH